MGNHKHVYTVSVFNVKTGKLFYSSTSIQSSSPKRAVVKALKKAGYSIKESDITEDTENLYTVASVNLLCGARESNSYYGISDGVIK